MTVDNVIAKIIWLTFFGPPCSLAFLQWAAIRRQLKSKDDDTQRRFSEHKIEKNRQPHCSNCLLYARCRCLAAVLTCVYVCMKNTV